MHGQPHIRFTKTNIHALSGIRSLGGGENFFNDISTSRRSLALYWLLLESSHFLYLTSHPAGPLVPSVGRVPLVTEHFSHTNRYFKTSLDFIVYLTAGPLSTSEPVFHTLRSSASSFNFQYHLVSLTSSSKCLSLLLHLPALYFPLPFLQYCFRRRLKGKCDQSS